MNTCVLGSLVESGGWLWGFQQYCV